MELTINLGDAQDVANGLTLLNAVAVAIHTQQQAQLAAGKTPESGASEPVAQESGIAPPAAFTAPPQAARPAPPPAPSPAPAVVPKPVPPSPAPAQAPVPVDATATTPKRRGRPPGTGKKNLENNAKAASLQPVGVALAGVAAHDLAAALDSNSLPVIHDDPEPEADTAADDLNDAIDDDELTRLLTEDRDEAITEIPDEAPADAGPEPGMIEACEAPATVEAEAETEPEPEADPQPEPETAATESNFSEDELSEIFGLTPAAPTPPPAPPAPVDQYEEMPLKELYAAWRAKGKELGMHYLRAVVQHYKLRSLDDVTRESMIDSLRHPEKFMPPIPV